MTEEIAFRLINLRQALSEGLESLKNENIDKGERCIRESLKILDKILQLEDRKPLRKTV